MIYFVILFLAGTILFISQHNKSKLVKKIGYIISFFIVFLPHGLRYGIGTDYFYTYVPYFKFISKGERYFTEPLFNFLNIAISKLTGDYKVLFFVSSLIFFYLMFVSLKEASPNITSSVILLFLCQVYFYSMNMIRQSIAISIVLFAFLVIDNRKKLKKIITVILASLFHSSAIFLLPFLYLSRKQYTNKFKIIAVTVCVIINNFFSRFIFGLISKYTNYGWYLNSKYSGLDVSLTLLIINLILFLLGLKYSKYENENNKFLICNNMNFFGFCLLNLTGIPLVTRLVRYFTIFQIVLIPYYFTLEKNKEKSIILKIIIYIILLIAVINQIYMKGGEGVLPYLSIFY